MSDKISESEISLRLLELRKSVGIAITEIDQGHISYGMLVVAYLNQRLYSLDSRVRK